MSSFRLLQIKKSINVHLIISAVRTVNLVAVVQPAAVRKVLRAAPGGIRRGGAEVIAEVLTASV